MLFIFVTLLQDVRLTEGVVKHKAQGWARVAEFMGHGLSAEQCMNRWNISLRHLQKGLNTGNWQSDDVPHPYFYYSILYIHLTTLCVYLTCMLVYAGRRCACWSWCHSM